MKRTYCAFVEGLKGVKLVKNEKLKISGLYHTFIITLHIRIFVRNSRIYL